MMKRLLLILIVLNIATSVVNIIRGDVMMAIECIAAVAFGIFAYTHFN